MQSTDQRPKFFGAAWLTVLLGLPAAVSAQPSPEQRMRFSVPMSCAAYATLRAADYPEAVRIYDQRLPPRSYEEADLAALGLLWRHRSDFSATIAERALAGLGDDLQPRDMLSEERSRWTERLTGYSDAQRQAIADNCQRLYEEADRSCPAAIAFSEPQ